MKLDTAFMIERIPDFIQAALLTVEIATIVIASSLLIASIYNVILYNRVPILTMLVRIHVEIARNTPLLIQLFFLYFALPSVGIKLSNYDTAIIAMTFLGVGYLTEVIRSGIDAVPTDQEESGLAIGLSRAQLFRYIILPQALRISTPALFANFIFLLKETTVVSAIAIPEILYTTTNYIALYYKTYEMLLMMTAIYLLLFLPLSCLLSWVERRYQHGTIGT
ncbi:amino acid ABC transporter permease [Paenibacillus sp. SC116]|uniref:amino acid ABC transporter permease n=1 Tax=Paenibacillus sp. SC116 TaxID=2968986 RepID=UPI00215A9D0D|nr:amino acid ABC transporter permease [Paenibacillus sp. SC116]MCR8844708.1 amino acid ABC transporter permease [Paenibacillus sp. SC116]